MQWLLSGAFDYDQEQTMRGVMTPSYMTWSTVIGAVVVAVIINAFFAMYFNIVAKIGGKEGLSYGDWFAFTWWASMPIVVSAMLSCLVIMFSQNGFISLDDLSILNLNSLIFSLEASNPWSGLLAGLDLFTFWSIALFVIGLRSWLACSRQKALFVAAAPIVAIFSTWALYIGLQG